MLFNHVYIAQGGEKRAQKAVIQEERK